MKSDLELRYKNLEDDELLMIVHSHDFRPDAQELAWNLLRERGIAEQDINYWRDPTTKLDVPSWPGAMSKSEIRSMSNNRRLWHRIIFPLFIITGILGLLGWQEVRDLFRVLFYVFFLLPGISWSKPLRILLFRPFEYSQSRKRTRRFAKQYLRYMGHTYTITDNEVKPRPAFLESFSFLMPLFTPALSAISFWWLFRPYFQVRWDEDILRLKDFIGRRIARNIAWALSWDKLFKISCTTETWKHTVQHLINSTQLIVVDLSDVGEGLKWELNEVRFYGATRKLVFVVHESSFDSALSFLKLEGFLKFASSVFVYGNNGLAKRHEELCAKLTSVASNKRAPRSLPSTLLRRARAAGRTTDSEG